MLLDLVAIFQFLADKCATATYPAGTVERALQDGHLAFVFGEVDEVLWVNSKHRFAFPKALRVEEYLGDKPCLMRDTFTVAHLIAAHCLSRARAAQFEVEVEAVIV